MNHRFFLIAAVIAIVGSPAFARTPKEGSWEVEGQDTTKWLANMVLRSDKDKGYSGYFIWTAPEEKLSGDELFVGKYDAKTNNLQLTGVEVRNRNGIAMGLYRATVSEDGKRLSGFWGSSAKELAESGVWQAKWVSPKKPTYNSRQTQTDSANPK